MCLISEKAARLFLTKRINLGTCECFFFFRWLNSLDFLVFHPIMAEFPKMDPKVDLKLYFFRGVLPEMGNLTC
jgi:hypothetical protein